jgi:hypothetical protein
MNDQGNSIIEIEDKSLLNACINETGTMIFDFSLSRLREDGSACSNFNSVTPSGGDPATIVAETNNITQSSVSTYETVNADFMVNPITIGITVNCNNP